MTAVNPVEALGYLASILVFLTFCMKTLVPLRIAAISSNLAFLLYGFAADLMPIILLHGFLLPLNIFRTWEQLTSIQRVRRAARGEVSIDLLLGSMTPCEMREGDVIFRKGDVADRMYYISSGQIRLEELDKTIGRGVLLGEVGLFSNEQSRTATAVCVTTGEIHWIERDRILKLCQEHPEFGFALTRLISNRMAENQRQMESRIRELERTVRDMKKERISA
ncbi:Crp/Fnr family transcriptional regulator [Ovoidimarina sediminis]|uniref:Crp/Fnr family transcriptional regulator n=1 Tax=Ovoidimarina sediminis TaxID=3079856 RepID=UPI002913F5F9|nr:cyclic nucleotide-binding domain-containing protein [Rhodophyticola sp. MJ-SS7]MDU8945506.1 cyclic nucleotide-binding domain-containing protein [Rhodophyticola sp. MJ-SS7]